MMVFVHVVLVLEVVLWPVVGEPVADARASRPVTEEGSTATGRGL